MIVIKLPTKKSITSVTTKELTEILKPYYGDKDKGQYFIGAAIGQVGTILFLIFIIN